MMIVLLSDPSPQSTQPAFVKCAYRGLRLKTAGFVSPENRFPLGAHFVSLPELVRKMCTRDLRAYQWFVAAWGDIALSEEGDQIKIPIPVEHCEEIPEVVH